jgi:hypothetical protein
MAKTNAQKQQEEVTLTSDVVVEDELVVNEDIVEYESSSTELALAHSFEQQFLTLANSQHREESPFKYLAIVQDNGYTDEVDGEVIDVPFGNFHICGTNLFDKEIKFRPILSLNKIMKRAGQEDKYKVIGETIYFTDWRGESRVDTLGTVDCGRLFGKAANSLPPELLALEKQKATLYTDVYGLATIKGSEPVFVRFRVSKGKSVRWSNATDSKVIRSNPHQREFTLKLVLPKDDPLLTPQERGEARNTVVNLLVSADMSKLLPTSDVSREGGMLLSWMGKHNDHIKEKHLEAMRSNQVQDGYDSELLDAQFEVIEG